MAEMAADSFCSGNPPNLNFKIDHFPPLSQVAWRVLELTSDMYTGAAPLAEIISRDQALTARILRIANSAFFQRCREIHTVQEASTVLGNRRIRGIVVAASLGGVLYQSPHGRTLWEHAIGVGLAARDLSRRLNQWDPEEVFVAGLLHDIGKSLFDYQYMDSFVDVVELVRSHEGVSILEAERLILGTDHTEVGTCLVDAWDLPESLVKTVRYHHSPSESEDSGMAGVVAVADAICLKLGIGPVTRPHIDPVEIAELHQLGLPPDDLNGVCNEFLGKLEGDKKLIGIH